MSLRTRGGGCRGQHQPRALLRWLTQLLTCAKTAAARRRERSVARGRLETPPIASSRGRRGVWRRGGVLLRLLNALESRRRRRYRGSQASGQLAPERRATGSQRWCRAVGTEDAPPDFGRSVNIISTRGHNMPTTLLCNPPDFQTFLRICGVVEVEPTRQGSTGSNTRRIGCT
jgi:hypothetical protein